jgi:thiol-disulfide isomerase/thioredoxin
VAKFADPNGTGKGFTDFGLPRALAAFLALILPLIEIGIAVALVPVAAAWYGACGALALLTIFIIGIGITLARGRKPDCNCFGQLHSAPIGWQTLTRNGLLVAITGWLVLRGAGGEGPSLWDHLASAGDNERRFFAFGAFILAFLLFRAFRRRGAPAAESASEGLIQWDWESEEQDSGESSEEPRRAETPRVPRPPIPARTEVPIDALAPEFILPSITGAQCSLSSLHDNRSLCLIFASPHCEPCRALWPHVSRWAREYQQTLNFVIVGRDAAATKKLAEQHGFDPSRALLQREFEISNLYGVQATPAAVMIGADGLVHSRVAVGRDDIRQLISSHSNPSKVETPSDARG